MTYPTPVCHVMMKMLDYTGANKHDKAHFVKVHSYARSIGLMEGLDADTQQTLEVAALVHDIACPLCREKYGKAPGVLQEQEGPALALALIEDVDMPQAAKERAAWLVGHHHTVDPVDGIDHRILLEADYLVNADEGNKSMENILSVRESIFRTESGRAMLDAIYGTGPQGR